MAVLADILLFAAALGAGVVAGLCFTFSSFLLRSFDRLGPETAIRVMQSLNAEILRSGAMAVWFGTAVVGLAGTILAEQRLVAGTALLLYVLAAVGITGLANVPRNESLDQVDPTSLKAKAAWDRYHLEWGKWNTFRTVLMALASVGFTLALCA